METRTLRATLHSGTTAAGNGTAATNPTGGGLILGTLSGSGAITASVVVEISAAGSVWVPLREPERINGAGSVPVQIYYSTTAAQVRLRVVDITGTLAVGVYSVEDGPEDPLTQTPSGAFSLAGPLGAPNVSRSIPTRGVLAALGTSTIGNATTTLANGVVVKTANSIWDRVNDRLGNRYTVVNYGYSGTNNATLMARLQDTVLPTKPAICALHFSANNLLANDLASAESSFATLKEAVALCLANGTVPIIVTPHLQTDVAGKWRPTVAYDTRCQEWGIANDVMVVSGAYAIAGNTDKTGTAKTGVMVDTLHISALGCQWYVEEVLKVLSGQISWRLLSGGNVEWAGQLHNNPRCTGSGAASGTGISGTRCANISPTRFSGTPNCVCSVGTDAEGAYMDLEITFAAANDSIQVPETITLARYLDGKSYASMCDLEIISGLFVRNITLSNNFASGNVVDPSGTLADTALPLGRYTRRLPVWTKTQTAPAVDTTHRAIIYGNAAGTSVVRCRALGCREVEL